MKKHLSIKEFFGYNENAIQIQIYTAISDYCIVAIAEYRPNLGNIYEVQRVLQCSPYEKTPLRDYFGAGRKWQFATDDPSYEGPPLLLYF